MISELSLNCDMHAIFKLIRNLCCRWELGMICDYDALNVVDGKRQDDIELRVSERREASSGSLKMILICEMGQTRSLGTRKHWPTC